MIVACLLPSAAAPGSAQVSDWNPGRQQVTREVLQAQLDTLERTVSSSAYGERLRSRARVQAALIRTRLADGDFQVGDRVMLVVEGEPRLTDTFTVETGRILQLPQIGSILMAGVLRSELTAHLTQQLGQQIRNPAVQARSLIRISILGEVNRPGYYILPVETLIEDALSRAGGPARTAKLQEIRVERGDVRIWEGEALQHAITEGRTFDALGLHAGDRIVVPAARRGGISMDLLRTLPLLLTAVLTLTRVL